MKTEYIIEHKLRNQQFYHKSHNGFKNKETALKLAEKWSKNRDGGMIEKIRVVEQKRRTIKVFK